MKHLLTLLDLERNDAAAIIDAAIRFKLDRKKGKNSNRLKGKTLGLLFEKPSTRTRVSFVVAMAELGGQTIVLEEGATQISRGESYADTARVLSRYLHGLVVRTDRQTKLTELAAHATIPIINGLSDLTHPCQIFADLMTVVEERGTLKNLKAAYIGDGNNLANSWIEAATLFGFELRIAAPAGFEPPARLLPKLGVASMDAIRMVKTPEEAARGANVIATDTWFSMGQTNDHEVKRAKFAPYQVNEKLLSSADPKAIVLHCLPAHRGEEITDAVLDGPQSRVLDEAENRLHVQKAILARLMG